MPPDRRPLAFLRDAIRASISRLHPSATLSDVSTARLTHYAHELAFGDSLPDVPASDQAADLRAQGWVVRAPDEHGEARTRRHYVVADVDLGAASEWFPALLGVAARLRSHLGPDEQADVAMLLVAHPGDNAVGRVSVLERNEAFAQVLVWTPGVDAQKWTAGADDFVARLRLSPIEGLSGATGRNLSPVDAIFEGATVGADVRAKWRDVLMDEGAEGIERARRLLEAMDDAGGGHGG